jgi:uncharacterized protein (TIGR00290 family)
LPFLSDAIKEPVYSFQREIFFSMKKAFINWSGGKDASMALWMLRREGKFRVDRLLTSMNSGQDRISMHGVRRSLLERQAAAIGLPLYTLELPDMPDMPAYEHAMQQKLEAFREEGLETAVFGDIFLEDLRQYREAKLAALQMEALFPLWKLDTRQLLERFIAAGFRAVVVCTKDSSLPASFCGRELDASFLRDLPAGVDPCGEHGEFHSFVYDGPIFKEPVAFERGAIVQRWYKDPAGSAADMGFHYCDLLPG